MEKTKEKETEKKSKTKTTRKEIKGDEMESKLLANDKEVVVPGEVIATGMEYLPSFGTYRLGDQIRANQLGLLRVEGKVLKTIPVAGAYLPKLNDVVIGKVIDILMSGWRFDINGPYSAVLPLKDASFDYIRKGADLTTYFNLDDYVVTKITQVTSQNLVDVTMRGPGLRKLEGGRVLRVNTNKIPRVIGKRGSMVSMIKHATNCQITVGQNGLIWLRGEPKNEVLAVEAIKMIEAQAHVPGLTNKVKEFLEEQTGKELPHPETIVEQEPQEEYEEQRDDRPPRRNYDDRGGDRRGGDRPPRHNYNDRSGDRPPRRGPRQPRRSGDRRGGNRSTRRNYNDRSGDRN